MSYHCAASVAIRIVVHEVLRAVLHLIILPGPKDVRFVHDLHKVGQSRYLGSVVSEFLLEIWQFAAKKSERTS